ncbi:MAG TPA: GNAT family N-acetyltransferase [Candidatus Stackebrandtia faecavium]|nr:GNAT family N-acetyltransferase [Candidatus Stackebrandtia faecavium]
MNARITIADGREAILSAFGDDPFVSCFVSHSSSGIVADGGVVFSRQFRSRNSIMCYGDPEVTTSLLPQAIERFRPERCTMPVRNFECLDEPDRPIQKGRWVWFYTRTRPDRDISGFPGEWLDADSHDAIEQLLDDAFPTASMRPSQNASDRRWFGSRDETGRLISCGAASGQDGVGPMLNSIAVHPDSRKGGVGSDLTAWVTNRLFDEGNKQVSLGAHLNEPATHRMYRRLGYHQAQELISGEVAHEPAS